MGDIDFTLDFYSIEVADYFSAISTLDVSTDPTSGSAYDNYLALDAAGVSGANSIGGVFYFTNAYDVSVSGWDLVATYPIDWESAGSTVIAVTLGNSEKEFDSDPSAYLNEEGRYDVINFDPNMRMVTSLTHSVGDYKFMTRWSYWGEASNFNSGTVEDFDPINMIDMELSYFADELVLAFGVRNLFDSYPSKDTVGDACCGRIYNSGSGMSWNGGYWYLKAKRDF